MKSFGNEAVRVKCLLGWKAVCYRLRKGNGKEIFGGIPLVLYRSIRGNVGPP